MKKLLPFLLIIFIFSNCAQSSTDCVSYKGTTAYKGGGKLNHNYKNRKGATPVRKSASF